MVCTGCDSSQKEFPRSSLEHFSVLEKPVLKIKLFFLSFGPNVKNMIKQFDRFQKSHFSSSYFFSFIHTRSPWPLIDQFENSIGILKAKAKPYMAKIKQIALKMAGGSVQCWWSGESKDAHSLRFHCDSPALKAWGNSSESHCVITFIIKQCY